MKSGLDSLFKPTCMIVQVFQGLNIHIFNESEKNTILKTRYKTKYQLTIKPTDVTIKYQ